jgi:DNA polymerase I
MRRAVFVLGTPERRAVAKGESLTHWMFTQLDELARAFDLDASIVFAVADPYWASASKTSMGIDRIRADRARVLEEISGAKPDLVVLFGGVAAACVMDRGNCTEDELQRRKLEPFGPDGPPVYYTHSVEQTYVSPGMSEWWHLDTEAALRGDVGTRVEPWTLNDNAGYLMMPDSLVGFDLETTGLNPWDENAAIRMIQIATRDEDGLMVTRVWDWDKTPLGVLTMLADPTIVKVGANIAFDVRWCRRFGVTVNNYRDVLVTEHVLCPGNPRLTLKDLAFKYFPQVGNYQRAVYALARKFDDNWALIPAEDMYEYAAADAQVSLVCGERQLSALTEDDSLAGAARLLWDVYPIFTDITANGARIDLDRNSALDAHYQGEIARLRGEITQVLGPVNPNSADQLARALKQAVPSIDLTPARIKRVLDDDPVHRKKGSVNGFAEEDEEQSTDKVVLEREAAKHPIVGTILEFRKLRVRHSTFIQGIREKHLSVHSGHSFIHPDFRTDVTDTYRPSSRNPNGQNFPRNKEDAPEVSVKSQFGSRFMDGCIVEMDLSQIELRVAAWLSRDSALWNDLSGGGDVHRRMAATMLGKRPEDVTDHERQECKTRTFLIMYGGGANKLAQQLKVSKVRASNLIREFFEAYPELERAIQQEHELVRGSCATRTPFGFLRRYVRPQHWRSADGFMIQRQAWNTVVQNTAACMMYCAMIRFTELLERENEGTTVAYESVPVLQIHDSIVLDAPGNESTLMARLLQQAVRESPDVAERYGVVFDAPVECDIKQGPNWAEARKV